MAWNDWGNQPINSTSAPQTPNSTTLLVAELDSTQLGTKDFVTGQSRIYNVSYVLGGDTNTKWQVGVCTSTALNAGVDEFFPCTPTFQTAQYQLQHVLGPNYRIRARVLSSHAGSVHAFLSAVPLT